MRWIERIRHLPRPARLIVGGLLIVLGLLGLFLPVLQGILFLALGGMVLSQDIPLFARWKGRWLRWRRAHRRRRPRSVTPPR